MQRADELLIELVELVETARAVPMSASCVVPREQVLDLLDDLRDVLPPEIEQARKLAAQRDTILRDAAEKAAADLDAAHAQAAEIIDEARRQAGDMIESSRAEHARLVSSTAVHQAAADSADQVRQQAEVYSATTRQQAEHLAATLRLDASAFAEQTLLDLVGVLQQAATTAERGRQVLVHRRAEIR